MPMYTVDDTCIKCGLCSELCTTAIIQIRDGKPFVKPDDEKKCIQCGQCVSFCPKSACFLEFQAPEERLEIQPSLMPSAESAETLLRSRRSIRRYKAEAVDQDLVRRIIDTCRFAPTASNTQLVRWVVTDGREKTRQLAAMVVDALRKTDAPSKTTESVIRRWEAGHDIIFRGAPHLAVAVYDQQYDFSEDAAIALTYFELAAHAHGVGCCWAGFFTRAARQSPEIQKYLGLKANETVVGGQMFGCPAGLGLSRILPPRKKINLTWL